MNNPLITDHKEQEPGGKRRTLVGAALVLLFLVSHPFHAAHGAAQPTAPETPETGAVAPVPHETEPFTLTLLHINDPHSIFEPGPIPALSELEGVQFGGYPAMLSYINELRSEEPNAILLHAGDEFQGSGYFILHHGRANAELINHFDIDAMVVGNHEFDELRQMDIQYAEDGETVERITPGERIPLNKPLADFLDLINFPMIGANMHFEDDPYLGGKTNLSPWVILEVEGRKIGVFGITLEDMEAIASPGPEVEFLPEIETAQQTVRALQEKGIRKIIGVSHIGHGRDKRIVRAVDGIDILVGGHSHDLLGDFTALGMPFIDPYPTVIQTPNGGTSLVVQAGAYAKAVGRLDVTFYEEGRVQSWSGGNKLLALADSLDPDDIPEGAEHLIARVKEDETVRSLIDRKLKPELQRVYGEPIAQIPHALRHERVPMDADGHGSEVAPLVAESLCWYLNKQGVPVDVSIVNAGSVRTPIAPGTFYKNQTLLEVMIFANSMTTFPLTGEQLRQVLDSVITPPVVEGSHGGRFPYAGRLAYVYDARKPAGERLVEMQVLREDGSWEDVRDDEVYLVAASSYVAAGQDGYDLLREFIDKNSEEQVHEDIIDNQVFTEYVMHVAADNDGYLTALPYPTVTVIQHDAARDAAAAEMATTRAGCCSAH